MSYVIEWYDSGVKVTFGEHARSGEINDADSCLYRDRRYDHCQFAIWDLSAVKIFEISIDEVQFSAVTDNTTALFSRLDKVILIASDKSIIDMFNEYVEHMKELNNHWEFRVFDQLALAESWLSEALC